MILKKIIFLIPSMITLSGLLCGLWSIFITIFTGRLELAICLIIIAAILDAFDGRIARFLHINGNFGVELDSLCDFLNFGVAPIFIFFWQYNSLFNNTDLFYTSFAILTLFTICMALRLARFNMLALQQVNNKQFIDLKKNFFFGFAAPIGAIALILPILVENLQLFNDNASLFLFYTNHPFLYSIILLAYIFVISLLLIVPIPIFSHKMFNFGIKKKIDIFFTCVVIALLLFFVISPLKCVFIFFVVYLCTIPISTFVYFKKKREILL